MGDFMIGTMTARRADVDLLKAAGVGWVRELVPFPFADRYEGAVTEDYRKAKAAIQAWVDKGFKVMGITPLLGFGGSGAWQGRSPSWMGDLTGDEFFDNYRKVCSFIARDLNGLIPIWQIGNEWYSRVFAGPLTLPRACELVFHSARGLKEAGPSVLVGTNMGGINQAYYMLGRLYGDGRKRDLDYCGVDQYFGTWRGGGPETWNELIPEWAEITGSRLLVNEWGYASEGELMTEEEKRQAWMPGDFYGACKFRKFAHAWGGGHTPEVQAHYVRAALKVFHSHRDKLLGCFFYRWEDQEKCWCGRTDCPGETRWGLVDRSGQPKPGFHAFRETVQEYFA